MKKRLGILRRFFCKMTHAAAAIAPLPAKKTNYHTFNISCQALLLLARIFLDGLEKWLTVNSYRIENSKRQTYSATYIEVVEVMW